MVWGGVSPAFPLREGCQVYLRRFNTGFMARDGVEIGLHALLFFWRGEQAQLAAAPKDVLRAQGPLLAA